MRDRILSRVSDRVRAARCPKAAAVIVAAGSSTRFGSDKLMAELCGKPVLQHSLEAFERSSLVSEIVLVTRRDSLQETASVCAGFGVSKLTAVVPGGETRTESGLAGVMSVSDDADIIAVHDGARPLVAPELIDSVVWAAFRHGAAAPAIPLKDTVKQTSDGVVVSTPDRDGLRAVQTPQCFQRDVIRGALMTAVEKSWTVTDDCMAVEKLGGSVWLAEGDEENIKITTPLDLSLAEIILQRRA